MEYRGQFNIIVFLHNETHKIPHITWQDQQDTVEIYYETIGTGEPVVFHHGNDNASRNWHDLGYVDALKNNIQMILIDCRGYGKSSKFHGPSSYSLKSRATDTIKVLDALNIQKAHMLGGSFTASFNMLLAKKLPQCQLEILPNMDHKAAYWDSATTMTPILSAFIRKHGILT